MDRDAPGNDFGVLVLDAATRIADMAQSIVARGNALSYRPAALRAEIDLGDHRGSHLGGIGGPGV